MKLRSSLLNQFQSYYYKKFSLPSLPSLPLNFTKISFYGLNKYPIHTMLRELRSEKVAVIGSGNWGTVIAKILGKNVVQKKGFDRELRMWVYEEMIEGRRLTDLINERHENVKYLPGIKLPENVRAVPDVLEAVRGATILVFVVPHQFVRGTCNDLKGKIHPRARVISLIKGFDVTEAGIYPISAVIQDILQVPVCTLSGANIANEIAQEKFSESTVGYLDRKDGELYRRLFETKYFRIGIINDVVGVELCGALKNVVAIGAGISDGLKLGDNSKAAIIRIGLSEMRKFCKMFYVGVKDETFFESCGVADLITTCYGGRNRKVAEAFVRTGKPFEQLEKELLNGQKLQGTLTAQELNMILSEKNMENEFPLFTTIYRIAFEGLHPHRIVEDIVGDDTIHDTPTEENYSNSLHLAHSASS